MKMNEKIISILKRTLSKEKYIEFAYIFGSFAKDKKYSDIDIAVMNHINFKFLNNIFKQGVLILDRNPELRTTEIEKNSNKVRECLGILKEAEIL